MATKKKIPARKNPTKKSTEKNFVLKFHTSLDGENNSWGSPMFYSESGQGWVADIGSATRYSESGADGRILQLLKEDKIASELVDLNAQPDNIFTLHTVFLDDGNVLQIITKVPQFPGDTYYLIPSNENIKEEDLVDVLKRDVFTALYDTNIGVVPRSNEEFLELLGYEFED